MASTLSSERKGSVLLQFFLIPGYPNGSAARIIFYIKIGSSKLCFGSAVSCTKDWYIFHSICMVKFSILYEGCKRKKKEKKTLQWFHTACSTILSWCTHILKLYRD